MEYKYVGHIGLCPDLHLPIPLQLCLGVLPTQSAAPSDSLHDLRVYTHPVLSGSRQYWRRLRRLSQGTAAYGPLKLPRDHRNILHLPNDPRRWYGELLLAGTATPSNSAATTDRLQLGERAAAMRNLRLNHWRAMQPANPIARPGHSGDGGIRLHRV